MRRFILSFFLFSFVYAAFSQNKTTDSSKTFSEKSKIIAHIFAETYYGVTDNVEPRAAFKISRGLFGFKYDYSDKFSAILIYDVSRTTRDIEVVDTVGNPLNVSAKEGSKYTGFLKLAELDYQITPRIKIAFGQLMTDQYTKLRNYWGYAYIYHTYQEKYGFGMPADFGTIITFDILKNLSYSVSVFNGEGPFCYQEDNKMIFANNLEFTLWDKFFFKFYYDYKPFSEEDNTGNDLEARSAFSSYFGYRTDKFKFGAEYNTVQNNGFIKDVDYHGLSFYSTLKVKEKSEIFGRYDYLGEAPGYSDAHYIILGYQYKPIPRFKVSLNLRELLPENQMQIYLNLGFRY